MCCLCACVHTQERTFEVFFKWTDETSCVWTHVVQYVRIPGSDYILFSPLLVTSLFFTLFISLSLSTFLFLNLPAAGSVSCPSALSRAPVHSHHHSASSSRDVPTGITTFKKKMPALSYGYLTCFSQVFMPISSE